MSFASTWLGSPAGFGAGNGSGRVGCGSSLSRIARSAFVRGAIGERVFSTSARNSATRAARSVADEFKAVRQSRSRLLLDEVSVVPRQ
jgi:hypothetical protein